MRREHNAAAKANAVWAGVQAPLKLGHRLVVIAAEIAEVVEVLAASGRAKREDSQLAAAFLAGLPLGLDGSANQRRAVVFVAPV